MKKIILLLLIVNLISFADPLKEYQFISPVPGSKLNSRESTIIIREGDKINPASIQNSVFVSGTKSGKIQGEVILTSDGKTLIFKPSQKYEPAETVTVTLIKSVVTVEEKSLTPFEYSFSVTPLSKRLNPANYLEDQYEYDFSKPENIKDDSLEADFPSIRTEVTGETGEGYVFLTVSREIEGVGFYIMMLNNEGTPFFYKKLPNDYAYDFKVQPNGLFSYAQFLHHHTYTGGGDVIHMVMDNSFTVVDSFQMGNGYVAEAHDFKILPNGHALLFGYDLQPMDLTEYGGYPNAMVAGTVVQELDNDKNVVFQWRSWDHYDFEDTYFPRITNAAFDPVHINSIALSIDGHILVSSNGLSEITKINRQTGEMIWRFGGKNNQFTFLSDNAEFTGGIHNVTQLPNGNLTFFDNPSRPTGNARAVEFSLDEQNMTAALVWEYVPDPEVHGFRRGSVQRLPNGNTIIGWGSASDADSLAVTEVTPDKQEVFKLYFNHQGLSSYRAFRFPFPDGSAAALVSQFELSAGNTYDFNEGSDSTGISVKINESAGDGYNQMNVEKYNYAPKDPVFFGKAPIVKPERIFVSQVGFNSINMEVQFDADFYNIDDPENFLVYNREFEGSGLFAPLATTYNPVTKKLSASADGFGEFILAKPDFESVVYSPKPFAPSDSEKVNTNLSVDLRWNPIGYVNEYNLQVSNNSEFSELLVDEDLLTEAIYTLDSLSEGSVYYWRVKSLNDSGESEWSEVYSFEAVSSYISIKSPGEGQEFQRGLDHFIVWEDNITEDVEIQLKEENDVQWNSIDTTESNGGYKWSISPEISLGSYYLRIRSLDDTLVFAETDYTFEITDTTTGINEENFVVNDYVLHQNYPNPFNPSTVISYEIPSGEFVELKVVDILGREVKTLVNEFKNAGVHKITFDASNLTSGIYFYSIKTNSFTEVKKMMLMK